MSLTQAVKGLIVVVAVLFGTSASALAHAGHAHGQSQMIIAPASSNGPAVATQAGMLKPVDAFALLASADAVADEQSAVSDSSHTGGKGCLPGACCCQDASTCAMGGHCCPCMVSEKAGWIADLSHHMRYHLARLGSVYPDIVFGLDRPPKA